MKLILSVRFCFIVVLGVVHAECCVSSMEQSALKNVNNYLNRHIYSYLETSGGQSSTLYLNVVHSFNTSFN